MIDDIAELKVASDYRNRMRIRCSDVYQETGQLSGGNQQKVVLSKWLMTDPKVLILDEPTRGIDVGAKYEIYCIINELAEAGRGVVVISSEMPELLGICDRICVMNDGAFVGEFPGAEATQEKIMRAIMRNERSNGNGARRGRGDGRIAAMTDKTVSLPEERRHGSFIKNNLRNYGMLMSLFAIMLFFQVMTGGTLLQPLNLTNLVLQNSYIVIMALGMLLVIVTGHIDLSVGSVAGFVGAVAAVLMVTYKVDYTLAFIACLAGRRGDRRRAGLLGRLFQDPVLHRDAGRHAGVQGPRARGVAGPVGRAVPGDLPEAVVGLHSGAAARGRHAASDLHADRRGAGAGAGLCQRQEPRARSSRTASRSSPTRSSSARASCSPVRCSTSPI